MKSLYNSTLGSSIIHVPIAILLIISPWMKIPDASYQTRCSTGLIKHNNFTFIYDCNQ